MILSSFVPSLLCHADEMSLSDQMFRNATAVEGYISSLYGGDMEVSLIFKVLSACERSVEREPFGSKVLGRLNGYACTFSLLQAVASSAKDEIKTATKSRDRKRQLYIFGRSQSFGDRYCDHCCCIHRATTSGTIVKDLCGVASSPTTRLTFWDP